MTRFDDNSSINFKFEELGLAAFKAYGKFGDPYGFAAQDNFSYFFLNEIKLEGRRALSSFLQKIIGDKFDVKKMKDEQIPEISALLILEKEIWEVDTQEDIIAIITKSIIQAKSLGY